MYAWIIHDMIDQNENFTQFNREIDKLKNKEQLIPQEAQHFDRILQKITAMQKFQAGDLAYNKNKNYLSPEELEALEGFYCTDVHSISLEGMLADSGLTSRTFFRTDFTQVSGDTILSTLTEQVR